jgi:hypothetical protein
LKITTTQREPVFVNNAEMELPLAKVAPISQNIKNFQKITIRFANLFGLVINVGGKLIELPAD